MKTKLCWISCLVLAGSLCEQIVAGDHWLTRDGGSSKSVNPVRLPMAAPGLGGLPQAAAVTTTTFDIVVSLYSNPVSDTERAPYEEIIRSFAKAVYEESNAGHKLGRVRIYRKGKQAKSCDILWTGRGWPCANGAGYGTSGQHIYFFDKFQDGNGAGSDLDFLAAGEAEGGGFTLGHEWGHYAYGLYDEYVGQAQWRTANHIYMPWDTDTPVPNAVMHSQWNAVGGNYEWLNFSTALNDTQNTAQYRAYGASCWEVLARSASSDPRRGARRNLPTRITWSGLWGVAPSLTEAPRIDLQGSGIQSATDELKIIWMSDAVAVQIVIDVSGSMDSDDKLEYAKTAARAMVDILPVPATGDAATAAVGIVAFDDTVLVEQAMTLVDSQAKKDGIKGVIDNLYPGGATAIYDAAQTGLEGLIAFGNTGGVEEMGKVTFLLTDGMDNSSGISTSDVITNYQKAQVPMFCFGFGDNVNETELQNMAASTGGRYYFSPVSQTAIQRAFLDANQVVTDIQGLTSGSPSVAPGATVENSFVVDDTVDKLTLLANHPGGTNGFQLVVIEPNGTQHAPDSVSSSGGGSAVYGFNIASPSVGTWIFRGKSLLSAATVLSYDVQIAPKPGVTYGLTVGSLSGETVTYPQLIAINAVVSRQLPISGAVVTAFVTLPDDTVAPLSLSDDGIAPDALAADGIYSALYFPNQDGNYRFSVSADNSANTARLTYASAQPATNKLGASNPSTTGDLIAGNFQRQTSLQVSVTGTMGDDHGDSADNATPLTTMDTDIAGRIDNLEDVDFFRVEVPAGKQSVAIRVNNLAGGISPILNVFSENGTSLLRQGDMTNSVAPGGYLAVPLVNSGGATFYASVSSPRSIGAYNIGMEAALPEIKVEQQPEGVNIADGGAMSFGIVQVGVNNVMSFTIRNTGTADLTNLGISKSGDTADEFTVTPLATGILTMGTSTTFQVSFNPKADGVRNATIQIMSNDANENPFDISLTGTGTSTPPPVLFSPEIVVQQPKGRGLVDGSVKTRKFGTVKVGKTGISKTFVIKNIGKSNLTRLAITKNGKHAKDFVVKGPLKRTLAPGASTTFKVSFKPRAKGTRVAAIHIRSNDANENPFDIKLTGLGAKP